MNPQEMRLQEALAKERRIIKFAGLSVLSACSAPASFIFIASHQGPFTLAFILFFSFCCLAFFFQRKRMILSKEGRRKPHRYQIGDEVRWGDKEETFVVTRHGFNHYYLRPVTGEQIYLVNRRKIESEASFN